MHGACFADKAGAEEFQDAVGGDERPPERMGRMRIVGRMDAVGGKRDGVGKFGGPVGERDVDVETAHEVEDIGVEIGHRAGFERQRTVFSAARSGDEAVAEEVEFEFENFVAGGIGVVPSPRAVT